MTRARVAIVAAAVVLVCAAPSAASSTAQSYSGQQANVRARFDAPTTADLAGAPAAVVRDGLLRADPRTRAFRRSTSWWGGRYSTATGESVAIYTSEAYVADEAANQALAEFLAGLVHGVELSELTVYVAPLELLQTICGSPDVAGCYSPEREIMVVPGEDLENGPTAAQVVTHEYGHHVATNRLNAPWSAGDYGTKRWSSHAGICPGVASGEFAPGDEGDRYALNPGEGFAEAYRVLNELRAGAPSVAWPIVSDRFYPDATALDLIVLDVTRPWLANSSSVVAGRFTERGPTVRRVKIATPLDGLLRIALRPAPGIRARLEVLGPTGTVVGRGTSVVRTVCGGRTFTARVTRLSGPGRFALAISKP